MERFSQRESVLLGYNLQRPLMTMNSSSSTSKPFRNSDVDFHDVFGGPPRRFSMQEVRRAGFAGDDDGPWSGREEKPVFGDDVLSSRRRYPSADFFDDIFGGDASVNSTPTRTGRDHPLLSSPGSRALSPLPPKAEPLGGSSLLAKFSLPAKLSKGVDFPTFGGSSRSGHKQKDSLPNGIITHSYSSGNSLSRFSSEATKGAETPKNDPSSSHQLSSLFKENPLNTSTDEESPKLAKSEKKDANGASLKKDSESSESSANSSSHFHFSIYKWASKGVPLDLPLRGNNTNSSRSKEMAKPEPLSGSNERADNKESVASKSSKPPLLDSSANGHALPNGCSSKIEHNDKLENGLPLGEVKADKVKPQSEPLSAYEPAREIRGSKEDPRKAEAKTIRSLLFDHDAENGSDEAAKADTRKKSTDKSTKGSSSPVVTYTKTTKKQERKNASSTASEVDRVSAQSSPRHARESNGRSKAKGRVKEFVKMFNQDTTPKPKDGLMFRSRSCKWNEKLVFGDETSLNTAKEDEKLQMPKANDDLKQSAKVYAASQDSPSPNGDSFSGGSKVTVEETDESFHDNFQFKNQDKVKELTQDENEKLGSVADNQEFKEIDIKIRQWTKGKEGNIRSLLSTLQYVLWAESGWKPVPLVDIIEGNAVKRAYQKALLCLHPDKLQQKGADSQQKYMAEKVFDTLQDAWNYFNSLGAV